MKKTLHLTQGFSLFELGIAMGVMAILASAVMPIAIRSVEIKAGEKTALEMGMIQEASRNYFIDHNTWPVDIQTLKNDGYLNPNWQAQNPWHNNDYLISSTHSNLTVNTDVPLAWAKLITTHLGGSSFDETKNPTTVYSTITTPGASSALPIGTIIPWSSNTLPTGFLWCNGGILNISDYPDLFGILGSTYGGNGVDTFALPDIRGRTIIGLDNMGGSSANVMKGSWASNLGGKYGEETHQLTIAEMPRHNHKGGIKSGFPSLYLGWTGGNEWLHDTDHAGGDQPHNIVQPSIAIGYIIKY